MLLRIEDIDTVRCRPEYERAAIEDLKWLGIQFETTIRRQSDHLDEYATALQKLIDAGLAYPSFLSRSHLQKIANHSEGIGRTWPRDPDGALFADISERKLSEDERRSRIEGGEPHAWRLNMDACIALLSEDLYWRELSSNSVTTWNLIQAEPSAWGDIIVARKDIHTSYHLAVAVDDAIQGVTHIVRGMDLYQATSVHRLLQILLGLPEPTYYHHKLIEDHAGEKLAKRRRDTSLGELRSAGITPAEIRNMLASWVE